jgi:hypothetical protein
MCFRDKGKFKHTFSSIVRWAIKENNPDFRRFIESLHIGIWEKLGRTPISSKIHLQQ